MKEAVAHHQAGRLPEAERLYRAVLEVEPRHPDANHNIGTLAIQAGKLELALPYFRAALDANPSVGQFWLSYIEAFFRSGNLDAARRVMSEGRQKGLAGAAADALSARIDAFGSTAELSFALAVEHHEAGRFEEAVKHYTAAVTLKPDHAPAHSNRGSALRELGRLEESAVSYRQAIERMPDLAEAYAGLGATLYGLGRLDEAMANYRRAIDIKPDAAIVHSNLGAALHGLGRRQEAESCYRRAIEIDPAIADPHNNLGVLLRELGRLEESAASCRRALEVQPNSARAHSNLANALYDLGRLDEAEAGYRRALEITPALAVAYNGLGVIQYDRGRLKEAEASYRRALDIMPDFAAAHSNRGNILRALGRLDEAEASCRRAIAIEPGLANAHNNLGTVLRDTGRLEEAAAACRRAVELKSDFAMAYNNLGAVSHMQGRAGAAAACCERALAVDRNLALAHDNLGLALATLGEFARARQHHEAAIAQAPGTARERREAGSWSNFIFTVDHDPASDETTLQRLRKEWARTIPDEGQRTKRRFPNTRDPGRRLRIGYVSGDFGRHSASAGFEPVLRSHNRTDFELYLYSNRAADDDNTARFREYAAAFRPVSALDDDTLEALILSDAIDILVDLSGHTDGGRLPVFARKPAPIQVTAWGYPTGTGLSAVDYLFADPVAIPEDQRRHFAERIWDLPSIVPFRLPDLDLEPNRLPALSRGHVTFGCFNRLIKVWPALPMFALLLKEIPDARLILKARELGEAESCDRVLRVLADHGTSSERIELRGPSSTHDHMAALHDVDIALDSFPQTGGVTTLETLWLGVPVVTMTGAIVSSRIAASILSTLGQPQLIASNRADYIAIARRLAGDLDALAEFRSTMRDRLAGSIICDASRYAVEVERAYHAMWRRWCSGG
jgi:predicted O-linked N-acetylglucosamine transferase (SPINDLY family)